MEDGKSELGVVLQSASQLRKAYGPVLGAILTWKALSAVKPRYISTSIVISIVSAAAGAYWKFYVG